MRKKWIAIIVLGIFFIIPFQVKAEEVEKERRGLISKTSEQLIGTTEQIVNNVETIVHDVEEIVPTLQPENNKSTEAEKTTLPVEEIVNSVTDTTAAVITEVAEGVDKTVKTLPEVPVVTPILHTTTETVNEISSEVQKGVNSSEETVKNIVDKVIEVKSSDSIVESPKAQIVQDSASENNDSSLEEEFSSVNITKTPVETNTPIDINLPIEPVVDDASQNKATNEVELEGPVTELEVYSNKIKMNDNKTTKDTKLVTGNDKVNKQEIINNFPFTSSIPLEPNPKMNLTSGVKVNGPGNTFSSGASFLSTGQDVLLGLLPSEHMLKELTKKKYYHKNSYAIIQWIHTPLRKPPEQTPFLYVI